jgi:H+/gluconate symporter-like permease
MVYLQAARKTGAYMILSLVLAASIVTFLAGDLEPTGRVTSSGITPSVEGGGWILFLLGAMVGALAVGTYIFLAHIEHKRDE